MALRLLSTNPRLSLVRRPHVPQPLNVGHMLELHLLCGRQWCNRLELTEAIPPKWAGKPLDSLHFRDFTEATAMALRAICLWPGLPAAWMLGLARGLLVALVYAWCICGLLLATFVWPDWLAVSLLRLLWLAAVGTWSVATVRNCMYLPRLLATCDAHSSQALISAQHEYLRGNWFDAEASVLQVLHHHPRDAEALLLLVGILRRTQRFQPALRRLKQLEMLQSAAVWHFEIQRESGWISRAMSQQEEAVQQAQAAQQEPADQQEHAVMHAA